MKLVIVGGHLSPALAVIEALPKSTQILFIGRKYGLEGDKAHSLEYQKITSLKIPFVDLPTGRVQRKFTRNTIPSLFKLPVGFYNAWRVLKDFKPDIVVCFGGYVQIPVAFAAFSMEVPIITHEQTRKAGLANRIIAPLAKRICISWEESSKYFPKSKTVLTGIPIRREFFKNTKAKIPPTPFNKGGGKMFTPIRKGGEEEFFNEGNIQRFPSLLKRGQGRFLIYITGGSSGAHAINMLIEGCIEKLLTKFNVIHQAGDAKEYGDFERLDKIRKSLPKELQERYKLVKFIDPEVIARIMTGADVVVTRSGANTIAELIYLGKPCILIPLPHGQANEQLENAKFLQSLGIAKILIQENLTSEILYSQVVEFVAKLDSTKGMSNDARKFIKYNASEKIVKIISSFASKNNYEKAEG